MEKIAVWVLCICLSLAGATHIFDNLYYGFLPYVFVPKWINIYWSLLGILDFLVVILLLKYRKLGLLSILVLMLSNVAVNSFVLYYLKAIQTSFPLQTQTLFLGICIGVTPWLWEKRNQGVINNAI
ncbi:hypothetical protein [Pseudoalteromonas ruthenica]|uniref:hypothetical protein n=1 Tax=Pseudoalteromonas ruthenica TaxID=151081 RepID=UPI00241EB036|nr:hypothetical protein [Pseudoalteromonas ruthenica]|tara:strand:- start:63967 stop:64344 length:378 start_codon:yes stop_codon:yes gene_type:complete